MAADDNEIKIDTRRREFLLMATAGLSAAGLIAASIPFVVSMLPGREEEILGAPIRVKIDQMKPGDQLTVMWRGKPIWIVRRDEHMLQTLGEVIPFLLDPDSKTDQQPDYAHNQYRSRRPEFLVLVGICTHLGCIPTYRPEPHSISPDWLGGFFCTCHGSKYDLAGRVYKNVPAPLNLLVPPYEFLEGELIIGDDKKPQPGNPDGSKK